MNRFGSFNHHTTLTLALNELYFWSSAVTELQTFHRNNEQSDLYYFLSYGFSEGLSFPFTCVSIGKRTGIINNVLYSLEKRKEKIIPHYMWFVRLEAALAA